jgi:hypothetical protein
MTSCYAKLLRHTVLMSSLCLCLINASLASAGTVRAGYSSFMYQLTDLDANDGVAPSLTWGDAFSVSITADSTTVFQRI